MRNGGIEEVRKADRGRPTSTNGISERAVKSKDKNNTTCTREKKRDEGRD